MITRRDFLRLAGALPASGALSVHAQGEAEKAKLEPGTILVNDVHAELNSARVFRIETPQTLDEVRAALQAARTDERAVCISGARHAMGGQQFCADAVMLDIRKLNRVLSFDRERGLVELESGVHWAQLFEFLHESQHGEPRPWAFAQKQAGADRFTIGGSLSANIHGAGLSMSPLIHDIESFRLVDARGNLRQCSRSENAELFSLAIGGYGLFGFVYSVTLRLVPRLKLERVVEVRGVEGLAQAFEERKRDGFLYGDFHLATDERSDEFLRRGVFTAYRPVEDMGPILGLRREFGAHDREEFLYLAHVDKAQAFKYYERYCLATNGKHYWSDELQMSPYPEGYHREVERRTSAPNRGSEALTEIYCEREALEPFLAESRLYALSAGVNIVSGSVRLVEEDRESFLRWARKPGACVAFNLHIDHTTGGMIRGGDALRRLIDLALRHRGGYYPAYHRYALRRQVDACLPQIADFLKLKRKYDPQELFQSDWYRHYKRMYFPER